MASELGARCYVRGVVADMMFDLVCQHCGRREQKRWESRESVSVTNCRFCKKGMSVVGIAFFVPGAREQAAA
ncbi:MAG: hypothetical protein E6I88_04710 [Chloroflexi bacterium]|nr:MAG: hypothetical protein E6I88_04710 [Chloroflexota bacterium]